MEEAQPTEQMGGHDEPPCRQGTTSKARLAIGDIHWQEGTIWLSATKAQPGLMEGARHGCYSSTYAPEKYPEEPVDVIFTLVLGVL